MAKPNKNAAKAEVNAEEAQDSSGDAALVSAPGNQPSAALTVVGASVTETILDDAPLSPAARRAKAGAHISGFQYVKPKAKKA